MIDSLIEKYVHLTKCSLQGPLIPLNFPFTIEPSSLSKGAHITPMGDEL